MTWTDSLRATPDNPVAIAISELCRHEQELAEALSALAESRPQDPEVHFLGHDLAAWSHEHLRRLRRAGEPYGLDSGIEPEPDPRLDSGLHSEPTDARTPAPERSGLDLLAELRHVHGLAAGVVLDWELLDQTAQALQDPDLRAAPQTCLPQTRRQLAWAEATLKERAPQIMVVR